MNHPDIYAKTLRIIAPSGAMDSPVLLEKAVRRLSNMGYWVELDPQCQAIEQRFAGTDEQRALALQAAIKVPDQRVIMAARGGYGVHRLLAKLDWRSLARRVNQYDHQLVGHSDFTAVQMALFCHGAPSYAGPCAGVDFGGDTVNVFMKQQLSATLKGQFSLRVRAKQNIAVQEKGVLWGGNLAMLCSLLGTPYFPAPKKIKGGVLFLEDVNERPYRVERMMNQLHLAGVLDTQSVIVLGDFGQTIPAPYDRGYDLNSVVDYMRYQLGLNVLTGLPFGHIAKKATLPIGLGVSVDSDSSGFELNLV